MTRVTISALAVLFGGVFAMGCAATPVPVLFDGLDKPRYTRCTMVPDKEKLYSSNYIGDGILSSGYKPGSPVVISMFSPQRVDLTINKIPHQLFPTEGEFSGGDVPGFLSKYFVDSLDELGLGDGAGTGTGAADSGGNPLGDPLAEYPDEGTGDHSDAPPVAEGADAAAGPDRGWRLDLMKPATSQSVKQGIAAVGMTKYEVYMAFGPPHFINFDQPTTALGLSTIMDANRWIYYTGWFPRTFTFGLAGKKVYLFDGTQLTQVQ